MWPILILLLHVVYGNPYTDGADICYAANNLTSIFVLLYFNLVSFSTGLHLLSFLGQLLLLT